MCDRQCSEEIRAFSPPEAILRCGGQTEIADVQQTFDLLTRVEGATLPQCGCDMDRELDTYSCEIFLNAICCSYVFP